MRSAMRLLSRHPQHLSAAGGQNLTFLLNGGRVNPVLRITDALATRPGGLSYAIATSERLPQHRFLGEAIAAKALICGSEVARERLFDHDVLARLQGLDSEPLM